MTQNNEAAYWMKRAKEAESKFERLAAKADKFEDGIDWIERCLQLEAELEIEREKK